MSKYYYLVSQLPFLKFGPPVQITADSFLAEAKKWLTRRDFSVLSQSDIGNFSGALLRPPVLRRYREFEFNLRKDISRVRQKPRDSDPGISVPVRAALAGDNPLEIEKKLLALRWKFIDEEEGGYYFDLSWLILYFLKIQILAALNTFNKEKGIIIFDQVCEVRL